MKLGVPQSDGTYFRTYCGNLLCYNHTVSIYDLSHLQMLLLKYLQLVIHFLDYLIHRLMWSLGCLTNDSIC